MNLHKTGDKTAVYFDTDINLQVGNVMNFEIIYFCLSSGFKTIKITRATNNAVFLSRYLNNSRYSSAQLFHHECKHWSEPLVACQTMFDYLKSRYFVKIIFLSCWKCIYCCICYFYNINKPKYNEIQAVYL